MNCQAQAGLLETLYGFGLDAIQKTKRIEKNANKLFKLLLNQIYNLEVDCRR